MTKEDATNLVKDHVEVLETSGRRQLAWAIRLLCDGITLEQLPEKTVAEAAKRGFDQAMGKGETGK